jgi:hypothetical protein
MLDASQIEAERATVPIVGGAGSSVCRMHGAGGGPPKGNRNALKHGDFTAEGLALKRQISALARMARETMGRSSSAMREEETMRRFMVHLVTEVDFEDGDEASDETVQNYQNHLRGMVQSAAQALSLRTIKGTRVETVSVEEIKDSPPDSKPPASV